jgi:hypothetical protein
MKAIDTMIAIEIEATRADINRFMITNRPGNSALALHQGFRHLQGELIPALEKKLISYCLDLDLLDADLITGRLKPALETHLVAMGRSIGASVRGPGIVGAVSRTIANYQSQVTAWCSRLPGRVLVAVERAKGLKATGQGGGDVIVQNVTGQHLQIGHGNHQTTNINITLEHFVHAIAASPDSEAKGLIKRLLDNATVGALIGAGATELLATFLSG